MENSGERLRSAMRKRGVNQSDMAKYLGISSASISLVVNGKQHLDFDLAVKACDLLGITLDWLAYGREPIIGTNKKPYYTNPERQRIEYLMSIMEETDYEAVIVCLERIIRIRRERDDTDLSREV
jgi:transcriptional regulator with XRE-family HTH domain